MIVFAIYNKYNDLSLLSSHLWEHMAGGHVVAHTYIDNKRG